jgi:hypothetical protein
VTVTKDIVFLEMNGHEYLVDVYVPTGEGLRPVAVNFHGMAPGLKDDSYVTVVAQAAAAAGMVVFAPNWVADLPNPDDLNPEFIGSAGPVYACALVFAQQEAAAYGGDPNHTVTYGYSGGAAPALPLAVSPIPDLPPGCLTQVPPIAPVGAVLGDGDHFFHLAFWDASFETEADAMQAFVAARVDPTSWTADQSTRFHIWAAADGTYPRPFDDPWDEEGWLAQRDPDGTIREDLDELGELDDGVITYIDGGLLLATRMQQAGFDATFDLSPGGHTQPGDPSNLVAYLPEVVAYLLDAAGTGDEDPFATPAVYEQKARDYCSSWPDVAGLLSEDANFADVSGDGLAVPDKSGFSKGLSEDIIQGRDAVVGAVAETGLSTVDCGDPAIVSGDWVALPVSASRSDGSGTEGIWIFRIVRDKVQWHIAYGTETDEVTPAPAESDSVLAAEARDFCAIVEGTGYVRDADEFLAAMTEYPLVHTYPEGFYWTGVDEVRTIAPLYPTSDDIWCGDDIATNGQWSAEPITIDNPSHNLSLVGMMVHHHIDGKIHSQFVHFTRTSGSAQWGLPLDE